MKKEYPLDTAKLVQPGTLDHMERDPSETEMNRIREGVRKYGIPSKCIITGDMRNLSQHKNAGNEGKRISRDIFDEICRYLAVIIGWEVGKWLFF